MATKKKTTTTKQVIKPQLLSFLSESIAFLKQDWRLLTGLGAWFLIALWVFGGLPSQLAYINFRQVSELDLGGALNIFAGLSSGQLTTAQTETQQLLGSLVTIIFVLAFIAAVRLRSGGTVVGIRDVLYSSSAPLIPFILLLLLTVLVLIPAVLGLALLSLIITQGTFTGLETSLFSLLAIGLMGLSIYFVLRFVIALIIVTLPNKHPVQALKDTKSLLAGKRLWLLARLFLLFLFLLILHIVVLVPVIILDSLVNNAVVPLVPVILDILKVFSWVFSIVYIYKLYRSML